MQVKPVPIAKTLFHRHTLRQISRHIHIQSLIHSHIVSKQLQRNHAQQWNQRIQEYIIRYFLQLQGTLHRHRIVHTTTQIQEVVRICKHSGDILDYRSLLQYLLHFLRNLRKFLYHLIIVSKEATTHTILQTVRLVINLLQHKVIKTTLAQFADVQIHGLDIVMTCRMLHNRSRITGDTLRTQPRHR